MSRRCCARENFPMQVSGAIKLNCYSIVKTSNNFLFSQQILCWKMGWIIPCNGYNVLIWYFCCDAMLYWKIKGKSESFSHSFLCFLYIIRTNEIFQVDWISIFFLFLLLSSCYRLFFLLPFIVSLNYSIKISSFRVNIFLSFFLVFFYSWIISP